MNNQGHGSNPTDFSSGGTQGLERDITVTPYRNIISTDTIH